MAGIKDIGNVWSNIREVDLRPIREAALHNLRIAVLGATGSGRHTLVAQMRTDPTHPAQQTQTPVLIADLEQAERAAGADLVIIMVDPFVGSTENARRVARKLNDSGMRVLVFINKLDLLKDGQILDDALEWPADRLVYASANNASSLLAQFVPAVLDLLPEWHLSLGRHLPLFRSTIADRLINETAYTNAAYSFSTGLAEIIPSLGIPLNMADIFILTKAQAFLVFKLGLVLGYSTRWQDYVTEFSSVIGSGFMWRQIARQLVGLIPVWGIVPKMAVAYAGTYVVGQTVLQWYLTGRHITRKQMSELYQKAIARGRTAARGILSRTPRLRIGRRKPAELPASVDLKNCPNCKRPNAQDAVFCAYCAHPFRVSAPSDQPVPREKSRYLEM